jgi:hypothetical protein
MFQGEAGQLLCHVVRAVAGQDMKGLPWQRQSPGCRDAGNGTITGEGAELLVTMMTLE